MRAAEPSAQTLVVVCQCLSDALSAGDGGATTTEVRGAESTPTGTARPTCLAAVFPMLDRHEAVYAERARDWACLFLTVPRAIAEVQLARA